MARMVSIAALTPANVGAPALQTGGESYNLPLRILGELPGEILGEHLGEHLGENLGEILGENLGASAFSEWFA